MIGTAGPVVVGSSGSAPSICPGSISVTLPVMSSIMSAAISSIIPGMRTKAAIDKPTKVPLITKPRTPRTLQIFWPIVILGKTKGPLSGAHCSNV